MFFTHPKNGLEKKADRGDNLHLALRPFGAPKRPSEKLPPLLQGACRFQGMRRYCGAFVGGEKQWFAILQANAWRNAVADKVRSMKAKEQCCTVTLNVTCNVQHSRTIHEPVQDRSQTRSKFGFEITTYVKDVSFGVNERDRWKRRSRHWRRWTVSNRVDL